MAGLWGARAVGSQCWGGPRAVGPRAVLYLQEKVTG